MQLNVKWENMNLGWKQTLKNRECPLQKLSQKLRILSSVDLLYTRFIYHWSNLVCAISLNEDK